MTVKEARELAKEWVTARARELPIFAGALFEGSITRMKDEEEFPRISDIDLIVVINRPEIDSMAEVEGEFSMRMHSYKHVILAPKYYSADIFKDRERVMGSVELAPIFLTRNIILDPTGMLSGLQSLVGASYKKELRVRQRCRNVEDMTLWWLQNASVRNAAMPGWATEMIQRSCSFYAASYVSAQMACVADLGGITTRKAFMCSRKLSEKYGLPGLHEKALEVMGSASFTDAQARAHMSELEGAFDAALRVARTPFWGRFFFQDFMRAIVIDGAGEVALNGCPREGMPFVLFQRCLAQNVIENDASSREKKEFRERFESLLSAFGINALADIDRKAESLKLFLPELNTAADAIIKRNGEIERS
jgi:hypothetical protein